MRTIIIITTLLLSGCMQASQNGQPMIEAAPGYKLLVCETNVGFTGGYKSGRSGGMSGGVALGIKWGKCK